jgi:hypothetical protein
MKNGDLVVYSESGKSYLATVLGVRELEHHSGKDGEPLLHLGFFAPVFEPDSTGKLKEVSVIGTHRQEHLAQFRLDVVHESHEFAAHLKAPAYPGGRWKEFESTEHKDMQLQAEADKGSVKSNGKKKKAVDEEPVVN